MESKVAATTLNGLCENEASSVLIFAQKEILQTIVPIVSPPSNWAGKKFNAESLQFPRQNFPRTSSHFCHELLNLLDKRREREMGNVSTLRVIHDNSNGSFASNH